MSSIRGHWDYLIISASNERQADAYEAQLRCRRELGLLTEVRQTLVVPDPAGKRVGSGGSTACCLMEVLGREVSKDALSEPDAWWEALSRLRLLIIHSGGDSMRLPAYGVCGKLFLPVPGESDSAIGLTLFDRQAPTYLALPYPAEGQGQVVVTAGDVLVAFEPSAVRFSEEGITGLGCLATPEEASRHGVYCVNGNGDVKLFLQKPAPSEQAERGAVDRYGRAILDIGVFSFDAATAVKLLQMCGVEHDGNGRLRWSGEVGDAIESLGMDFYGEVCCALGLEATPEHHTTAARAGGSRWDERLLRRAFEALTGTPFRVQVLRRCGFLHFGTTRQLITSGLDLVRQDQGVSQSDTCVRVNTLVEAGGRLLGRDAWAEGCQVCAPLSLAGRNVVTGVDVDEPLSLPEGACVDVVRGRSRSGREVWFIRCYGVDDTFKGGVLGGATFCGLPVMKWLGAVGANPADVWDAQVLPEERRVWNARLFPAESVPSAYRRWVWMFEPADASPWQREAWLTAERYSMAEIAELADPAAFHERRGLLRAEEVRRSLLRLFRKDSGFSAADLAHILARAPDRAAWVAELLDEAHWHFDDREGCLGAGPFAFSRIIHTLGTALDRVAQRRDEPLAAVVHGLREKLNLAEREWLSSLGLAVRDHPTVGSWADRARAAAFEHMRRVIVLSSRRAETLPRCALRSDEIVWGRVPARLDVGGGWTDTPPYSLEHGGCVINAAVNLNGQPPIQAYARVLEKPVIRIASIDQGARLEVRELSELLDYREAGGEFAVAKAALALSGFSPEAAPWPEGATLRCMLERFGGGIELTTLAAIPKGSGLGTSSIMGAVVLAVIQRLMGRTLTRQELFHDVLRLEQALTTGGGWQDQVGGVVDGVKVITTEPGLVANARIHYVPADVLDPELNGGCTLLYYTGLTRVAKGILRAVVGRYLDRDRVAMATLRQLRDIVPLVADAMARKDQPAFGRLVDEVWQLNKQLDPGSTNEAIEALLERVRPHVHGAKLLGAGGGGFALMVCKSPQDAASVRRMLEAEPPNDRARFFDFEVSRRGLMVTTC